MLSRETTMLPLEVKIFDKLALEAPSQKLSKTVLAIVMKSLLQQGGWLYLTSMLDPSERDMRS